MRELRFNVGGEYGTDTPALVPDKPAGAVLRGVFESPGRFMVDIPRVTPGSDDWTGGAWVHYQQGQKSFRVIIPPDADGQWEAGDPLCLPPEYHGDAEQVALKYGPVHVAMPDLTRDGYFLRSGGQHFTGIDRTEFALYERLLKEGEAAIDPVGAQRQALGFNVARIFLLNISVHHLLPWEWPNFYDDLPRMASWLARYNSYPHFVVFTQAKTLMPKESDQLTYLRKVFAALHETPCLVSKVNEQDQHDNGVTDAVLNEPKPDGAKFLLSNGSNGSSAGTVEPVADYGEYHTNDSNQWQRKVGHGPMEKVALVHGVWAGSSENTRADKDGYNLVHAYDAAASAALLCAFATCHTPEGKLAQPFVTSLPWAERWAAGARSVPLDIAHPGFYLRRDDLLDEPDPIGERIRVYEKRIGGRSHIVPVHA